MLHHSIVAAVRRRYGHGASSRALGFALLDARRGPAMIDRSRGAGASTARRGASDLHGESLGRNPPRKHRHADHARRRADGSHSRRNRRESRVPQVRRCVDVVRGSRDRYWMPDRRRLAPALLVLALGLASTALGVMRPLPGLSASASASGTLLVVDAWFDVLTAHHGAEFVRSTPMLPPVGAPQTVHRGS